ncbi:alpha/beta fold hydrolase [Noviherbaspirillum galbum]|uniref:Alpha/beta hydrolase n=1 Tax=Noviherbaspirillum galbum TaxID=2709383 RepID=A0A6B3SLS8_9BURK|nr:alpha/beta hydrolase [Noviherbaspirillum galbum]NEX61784.1 alpha/beta hydrolase [Noviherbaspirillum galbum]
MSKPDLHFAHANSFPAGTYRVFFQHLEKHYRVQALPIHAHDPRYPVSDGWPGLVKELEDDLARRYDKPVILVGHSLGGMLSLMAAKARPDLVRCVVLVDSPVVAGWRALVLRAAKRTGLDIHVSPAKFSVKRRNLWPDAQAAHAHFTSKPMFAAWAPGVLQDYMEHGLVAREEGVRLRFRPEIETAVYRTLPHHVGRLARPGFPVPVGFVGGTDSVECRQAGLGATRRLVGRHFVQIKGGHLVPMEAPAETARAVHSMIGSLLQHGPKD